ncbi:PepSY domain-containing protein [Legionella drozanskii]|nr:PepSY domain-containing protein [Legionella drozanskii]
MFRCFCRLSQPKVSIQQALSAAEKAGYTNIQKIEFEHGQWEVEGRDAQGKKFEVKIDASTGTLSKDND